MQKQYFTGKNRNKGIKVSESIIVYVSICVHLFAYITDLCPSVSLF